MGIKLWKEFVVLHYYCLKLWWPVTYQNLQLGPQTEYQVAFLDMNCLIFKRLKCKMLLGKAVEYHVYGLTFPSYNFPIV